MHEGDAILKSTKKLSVSYTAFSTRGVQLPVRRAFHIDRFYGGGTSFLIANRVGPRNTFCNITEDELCNVVHEVLQNVPDAGETYIIGAIRSRGMIVQRWRIRQAIQTVDPISCALRRTFAVVRRVYNVVCPSELW